MVALSRRRELSLEDYLAGIRDGDLARFSRAITLIESQKPAHQALAQRLLTELLPQTGGARRIGVTGVPGVGKSTFIEALGRQLTARGHRVAVLAVDPTSGKSGGSILGDKTRMPQLAVDPRAFIRPSPAGQTLGGVTRTTRETLLLCEAAGYDVVLVETVGVGQSETLVSEMVDCFLVLMLPGAGDELQGIKKGVLELADVIAVNKADGDNAQRAASAARDYRAALRIIQPRAPSWRPPVLTVSGLTGSGLTELWSTLEQHRQVLEGAGELAARRAEQSLRWLWSMIDDRVRRALRANPQVRALTTTLEREVREGRVTVTSAAEQLLTAFGLDPNTT
ncbi:MAG: methylmalonyl Co-A mutase-associated GTPase MeaB [Polyangiaceae bacterium]|nr:methylmalonyl Co-A mutase-associated GTPase MeaB [Polyangiaceae bacterium]MCW5789363.1 methylmalonyl Co-A mutase-associated GTPase MeaB [Polyangiaceae bacterium]